MKEKEHISLVEMQRRRLALHEIHNPTQTYTRRDYLRVEAPEAEANSSSLGWKSRKKRGRDGTVES